MSTFRERLIDIRKSHSLTQKQLAELIETSERGIQYYESGKRKPDFDILIKLADYFQISLDYLVGRSDNPERR